MAYLNEPDYSLRISVENLREILSEANQATGLSEDQIRANAEEWAKAVIKSFLSAKYNIDYEFGLTGTNRNMLVMQVTIDLVLFTVHKTINPRDIPDHILNGYKDSMQWLLDARDGKVIVNLAKVTLPEGEPEYDNTFMESQEKFVSKPYTDRGIQSSIYP